MSVPVVRYGNTKHNIFKFIAELQDVSPHLILYCISIKEEATLIFTWGNFESDPRIYNGFESFSGNSNSGIATLKRTIPIFVQTANAHRKPRWLPVAKSKIYRIPKRPVISDEEKKELLRLHNNYRTQMRAIRRFYFDEMVKEMSTKESATSEMSLRLEAEEWARCVELNDKWNAQVALEREERRKQEVATMEEYTLARMEAKDKELRARIEKASEEIRKQKELSKSFITPETLDAAIDHALANPTDYNFVIDLKGNKYLGRDTPVVPPKVEEKVAEAV